MAADAVLLKDAGDVAMVGDRRRLGGGGRGQVQFASGSRGGLHGGFFSAEQGGDGVPQVGMLGRLEVVIDAVLVVEGAAVDERASRIQQEHLCGGAGAERHGQALLRVVHVGCRQAGGGQLGTDILGLLAAEGVDEEQSQALFLQFGGQLGHRGQVAFADRTGRARHDDDEAWAIPERAKAEFLAVQRTELHVSDHATDADFARLEDLRSAGHLAHLLRRDLSPARGEAFASGSGPFGKEASHQGEFLRTDHAVTVLIDSGEPGGVAGLGLGDAAVAVLVGRLDDRIHHRRCAGCFRLGRRGG